MSDEKNMAATLSDLDKAAGLQPGAVVNDQGVFGASDLPASGAIEQPQNQQQLAGMLSGVVLISFALISKKRGDHWALDQVAADQAGQAYAAVIVKYFPDFAGGPELTAIAITAALVGPRVIQDKLNEAQKQRAASDGAQS